MCFTRPARIIGTTAVLLSMPPALSTQGSAAAIAPQITPAAAQQATSREPIKIKFAAPAATAELVGLTARSSDGMNLGPVYAAIVTPGRRVTNIGVRVGAFLGFGADMVVLPEGSFYRVNDTLQVNMTADEVNKLPKVAQN
jgi:hypothetical protein